ncbi:MAG: hypothetical protein NWQ46_05430, partial [Spirosomaceae bacterium]|nr:hypothetical protein [Spirosomataceae bacterium]
MDATHYYSVRIDAQNGAFLNKLTGLNPETYQNFVFTSDGKYLIGMGNDENTLNVWNISTGNIERSIKYSNYRSSPHISIAPGDKTLAIIDSSGLILYSLTTGEVIDKLAIRTLSSGNLKFSPDGKNLVATSDKTVYIFNTTNGISTNFCNLESEIVGIEFNNTGSILGVVTKSNVATFNLNTTLNTALFSL